jgi:GST-like protein
VNETENSMTKPSLHHLLGAQGCGSAIVEAMLVTAKIPYTYEQVDYGADSPTRARLLEVNPLGQVPAMVLPDGTLMTESAAIAMYLNDLAPDAKLIPPADHPKRAHFLRWFVFLVAALYPTWTYGDDPAKWLAGDAKSGKALRASTDEHRKAMLGWINAAADEKGPWFLGKTFSVIDLYFAFMSYWRPGRSWYEANTPRLFAIAEKAAGKPKIGKLIEAHMG